MFDIIPLFWLNFTFDKYNAKTCPYKVQHELQRDDQTSCLKTNRFSERRFIHDAKSLSRSHRIELSSDLDVSSCW